MINFYNRKFSDGSEFLVLKSLSYFEDAMPEMLMNVSWKEVKTVILAANKEYAGEPERLRLRFRVGGKVERQLNN
jgi:hypothetical protein